MCNCKHDVGFMEFGIGEWGLVINLFVLGLSGSFAHCIGMCGPFAVAISQMRMIGIKQEEMRQKQKVLALICAPYYSGKTVAYLILMLGIYYGAHLLSGIVFMKYVGFILLSTAALIFFIMGLSGAIHTGLRFKALESSMNTIIRSLSKIGQNGVRGFISGIILGFIPCGLSMAAIVQAAASDVQICYKIIAITAFGIATIPGMMLVTFLGNGVFKSGSKQIFQTVYSAIMMYNGIMLAVYAFRLIDIKFRIWG